MEEIERKIPEFNLQEVLQYLTNKETVLYETITKNTNIPPINIYMRYGLHILTIIFLQLRYGTRISELLRSTCSNIVDCHSLALRGTKHSRYRFVEIPYQFPPLLLTCHCGGHSLFSPTYKQVWRVYNQLGITTKPGRSYAYRAITHTGRIKVINTLYQLKLPQDAIRDIIGHRSIKSQLYYLKRSYNNGN